MINNNKKGFTLIELLVVVAIIGILAAVGTVAYNGYTAGAKANSAKTNHSYVVKYISSELMRCELGDTVIMESKLNCNDAKSPSDVAAALEKALVDKLKNPYAPSNRWVVTHYGNSSFWQSNSNIGQVYAIGIGDRVDVILCFKENCSDTNNRIQSSVDIR